MAIFSWGRFWRGTTTALLLMLLPAAALAGLFPAALEALNARTPQAAAAAAPFRPSLPELALDSWEDTATTTNPITISLVQQARMQSRALFNAVRQLRAQLATLRRGTLQYELVLQTLLTVYAEAITWNNTWRQIGRPRANQTAVQNRLIRLQTSFVIANTNLAQFQAREIAAGSVFAFSPPQF